MVSGATGEKKMQFVQLILLTMAMWMGLHYYTENESAGPQVLVTSWFCLQRTWEKAWGDRNSKVRNQTVRFITERQRSFYPVTGNNDCYWSKKEICDFYVFKVPKPLVLATPQQKPDLWGQEYLISVLCTTFDNAFLPTWSWHKIFSKT